jgi:hypothetical protein
MHLDRLVIKTSHIAIKCGFGQVTNLHTGTLLGHNVTSAYRLTSLINLQRVGIERHRGSVSFGILRAHNWDTAHRVDDVELDLVTGHLLKVSAPNERHIGCGLVSQFTLSV